MYVDKEILENFLNYMLDKTEPCYKQEVETAIKRFLGEED